ncbi:MAG TPA: DnaA N-terminal domain-containing protein, partial [Thermoanaerobaculia bacterium]|nr:DnaA N-terminal domain-containing protein [Thermoanaerobaculia bacterium]
MTEVWSSILKRIETKLDPKELKTWFAPTRQLELDASGASPVLTVAVPSRMFADWIESRHGELLAREAEAEGLPGLEIRFESGSAEPSAAASVGPAAAPPRGVVANPKFTFDTFVVGSSNQFAHAAARAVAETPSRS